MPDERGSNTWNSADYDGRHSFVYEHGEAVLELLAPEPGERVLDLGCGTGHLTDQIARTGATVVGVDSSAAMVEAARSRYPDLTFVQADARELTVEAPFDAVFSNAMLHWITDHDAVLPRVRAALRPGGRFVAELGGRGNVEAIVDAVNDERTASGYEPRNPWYFPSVGEYTPRLEAHGFEVRLATLFDRPTELDDGAAGLANWLEMFGDELFEELSEDERRAVVASVEDRLRPSRFREGTWIADYRRLRFLAVRE